MPSPAHVFRKLDVELKPDPSRTVIRPFSFDWPDAFSGGRPPRPKVVADRVRALDPSTRSRMWDLIAVPMAQRHRNTRDLFLRRFNELEEEIIGSSCDETERLLIGAYFSQEYAFESAALFNPSILRDRDEPERDDGGVPVVLSLRGIGEGHVSSVTLRTGVWWPDEDRLEMNPPSRHGVPPRVERHDGKWVRLICEDSEDLSETVFFPILPSQRQGVEDLRLVEFVDDDGATSILGTYTAFDGGKARTELMRGVDFRSFEMRPLEGAMSGYKGMALFPRRIDGRFVMLGRQDSESVYLLRSDDLTVWETGEAILSPKYPWEFVQMGNCGSPIEVEEGWLVFTHGVGMVRGYCIGACLLNRDDPAKVLARTPSPLLFPSAEQRGGYVPNVTYSCGALVEGRRVLLPYAIGDEFTAFATASLDDLLGAMTRV